MARQALTEGLAQLFRLKTGQGRPVPYVMPEDPSDEALRIAQANASKPVEEGGLGLSPENTAIDRAQAMGYRIPFYHGTDRTDLVSIDPRFSEQERVGSGSGAFGATADNPELAEMYASKEGGVYPLLMRFGVAGKEKPKVGDIDFGEAFFDSGEDVILTLPDGTQITSAEDYRLSTLHTDDLVDIAKKYDLDAIQASNVIDLGPYFRKETVRALKERGYLGENVPEQLESVYDKGIDYRTPGGEELVVFKEGELRAPNAAFDPMRRGDPSLTAAVAGTGIAGLLSSLGSGTAEAAETIRQNLDPRTMVDMGLMGLASFPNPLMLPAVATELGLFALDAANALSKIEQEDVQSGLKGKGQMKRRRGSKSEGDVPQFANGGIVEVIKKQRRQLLDD
jgi:hypothetical protein